MTFIKILPQKNKEYISTVYSSSVGHIPVTDECILSLFNYTSITYNCCNKWRISKKEEEGRKKKKRTGGWSGSHMDDRRGIQDASRKSGHRKMQ